MNQYIYIRILSYSFTILLYRCCQPFVGSLGVVFLTGGQKYPDRWASQGWGFPL